MFPEVLTRFYSGQSKGEIRQCLYLSIILVLTIIEYQYRRQINLTSITLKSSIQQSGVRLQVRRYGLIYNVRHPHQDRVLNKKVNFLCDVTINLYLCDQEANYMGKLELILETEKVSMYSPRYDGEEQNEFRKFLISNKDLEHPQLKKFFGAILSVIEKMGETGALERNFRPEGGNVKALPTYIDISRMNKKVGKVRLYCLRLSDRMLILGGGAVTKSQKYEDDPVLLTIVGDLRDIECHIKKIIKQADTDYEDFDALKRIIESITI